MRAATTGSFGMQLLHSARLCQPTTDKGIIRVLFQMTGVFRGIEALVAAEQLKSNIHS